jgi:hypothetical protein
VARGTDAEWSEDRQEVDVPVRRDVEFRAFGYVERLDEVPRPGIPFIGFDELTQFDQTQRPVPVVPAKEAEADQPMDAGCFAWRPAARRADIDALAAVPLRFRAASNPGGPAHDEVKSRYGLYRPDGDPDPRRLCERPSWVGQHQRIFIPSRVEDNPGLDVEEYVKSLSHLGPDDA